MQSKLTFKESIQAGLLAGVTSAVINAVLFFVFHEMGVLADTIFVQPPNQPLVIGSVIVASLVPSLIGSIVFFLIEKFTSNGYRIFSILAITLAVLSLFTAFKVPVNVTMGYSLVLCVMHLVVAFVLVYFIGRSVKQTVQA